MRLLLIVAAVVAAAAAGVAASGSDAQSPRASGESCTAAQRRAAYVAYRNLAACDFRGGNGTPLAPRCPLPATDGKCRCGDDAAARRAAGVAAAKDGCPEGQLKRVRFALSTCSWVPVDGAQCKATADRREADKPEEDQRAQCTAADARRCVAALAGKTTDPPLVVDTCAANTKPERVYFDGDEKVCCLSCKPAPRADLTKDADAEPAAARTERERVCTRAAKLLEARNDRPACPQHGCGRLPVRVARACAASCRPPAMACSARQLAESLRALHKAGADGKCGADEKPMLDDETCQYSCLPTKDSLRATCSPACGDNKVCVRRGCKDGERTKVCVAKRKIRRRIKIAGRLRDALFEGIADGELPSDEVVSEVIRDVAASRCGDAEDAARCTACTTERLDNLSCRILRRVAAKQASGDDEVDFECDTAAPDACAAPDAAEDRKRASSDPLEALIVDGLGDDEDVATVAAITEENTAGAPSGTTSSSGAARFVVAATGGVLAAAAAVALLA